MDIYEEWKSYKKKMEDEIVKFNELVQQGKLQDIKACKDNAKKTYLQFVSLLKTFPSIDQDSFSQVLAQFFKDIKKMSEYVKNFDQKKILNNQPKSQKQSIMGSLNQAIVRQKPNVTWDDVAGLTKAKQALKQAVILPLRFPQIFTGSRRPWKGILLYGPPGTGKTFIAKACAKEMEEGVFFSVSSSDIMSKYVGESEKIVKCLFDMARKESSSIIFIDEVDSMASNRSEGDNESSRRVKTEFLVQMDGVGHDAGNRVLVIGATNLPWELDPAIRRRFQRRIYIPLPELQTRTLLFKKLCSKTPNVLTNEEFQDLGKRSQGYSGSDIQILVKDAVYQPLRISQKAKKFKRTQNQKGQDAWTPVPPSQNLEGAQYFYGTLQTLNGKLFLPNLQYKHFITSLMKVKPSVDMSQIKKYQQFTDLYGQQG